MRKIADIFVCPVHRPAPPGRKVLAKRAARSFLMVIELTLPTAAWKGFADNVLAISP